jgi:hypothetical protein
VVLASLLQSCSSVCRVVERNDIYTCLQENIFLGCRTCFSPANLLEPLYAIVGGRHVQFPSTRRPAMWNSRHLETSSYTIIFQEGPSCKPTKQRTIRIRINLNKHHLSFSSLFTTRKVLFHSIVAGLLC